MTGSISAVRARTDPGVEQSLEGRRAAWTHAVAEADASAQTANTSPSATPASEPPHGWLWNWMHDHGLVLTKHERADILRRGWGPESGLIVRDKDGTPINVDQLSDDEVIALDKELRGQPIGHAVAGAAAPIMTQWGWQGSRQYRDAVNQLKQPGTHESLSGKVPSRAEATRMIEESGGKVIRQDEGHPPGGVSTHHEPHINYTTPSGEKATIIVKGA